MRFLQGAVRWNAVTFGQAHHIATHYLVARNAQALAVANDQCTRAAQIAQGGEGGFGAAFLHHGNAYRETGEPQQHQGFGSVAECEIDCARNNQQQEHGLLQYVHHGTPPGVAGGVG